MKKQKIAGLLEWAKENGARLENFIISNQQFDEKESTREIIANRDIEIGDEVLYVPNAILLTETDALNSVIGQIIRGKVEHLEFFSDQYPHALEIITLGVFMAFERTKISHWQSYLQSLPLSYNLPICWDDTEIELLKGTNLYFTTKSRKKWLHDVFLVIKPLVSDLFDLKYSDLLWAHCSILSRAFPKARSEQKVTSNMDWMDRSEIAMYPCLDMLNHRRNTQIEWVTTADGYQFIAREPFKKGNPLWLSYGPKGNENLLSNYGFVIDENPEDYYKVYLNVRKEDPLYQARLDIMKEKGLKRDYMIFVNDNQLPISLIQATKIMVANELELNKIKVDVEYTSPRLNVLLWHTLWSLMKQKLHEIQPCQISDEEHVRMATIYRNGQETILKQYILLVEGFGKEYLQPLKKTRRMLYLEHSGLDMEFGGKCIQAFETLTGEPIDEDSLYCVQLIHQLCNPKTFWHTILKDHFDSIQDIQLENDSFDDALDYYESLIVPLVEADPVTFQPTWFTKINVLWAYLYLERFGASISSDYLIASGFEMDSGRGLWVLFPQPV